MSKDYIKQNGDIKTHGLGRYVASFLISTRPVIPGLITGYYNHINKYCNKFVITVYIKTMYRIKRQTQVNREKENVAQYDYRHHKFFNKTMNGPCKGF